MQPMQPSQRGENAQTGQANPGPPDFRQQQSPQQQQWEQQQPEETRGETPRDDRPEGEPMRGRAMHSDEPESGGFEARIRDLENALAASRANQSTGLTPFHGAGPGTDINETWSQYEQEQAAADTAP